MLADPAKVGNGAETTWEADLQIAGSGVEHADGLWTKLRMPDSGPLPSSVTGRTLALCHNHDPVCALGDNLGWDALADVSNHTDYNSTEEDDMGLWAADKYLGLPLPSSF